MKIFNCTEIILISEHLFDMNFRAFQVIAHLSFRFFEETLVNRIENGFVFVNSFSTRIIGTFFQIKAAGDS